MIVLSRGPSIKNYFQIDIYRKSSTTDTVISTDSCGPTEYKYAVIRQYLNRLPVYPINTDEKLKKPKNPRDFM